RRGFVAPRCHGLDDRPPSRLRRRRVWDVAPCDVLVLVGVILGPSDVRAQPPLSRRSADQPRGPDGQDSRCYCLPQVPEVWSVHELFILSHHPPRSTAIAAVAPRASATAKSGRPKESAAPATPGNFARKKVPERRAVASATRVTRANRRGVRRAATVAPTITSASIATSPATCVATALRI